MANSLQELNTSQALEEWAVQIKECRNSGLTVREWCKSKGINTHKFYYWQKKRNRGLFDGYLYHPRLKKMSVKMM